MKLRVHQQNFLNECQLLLQLVLTDTQTINDMLDNHEHALWYDTRLNIELGELLEKNHESCQTIIAEAQVVLTSLR